MKNINRINTDPFVVILLQKSLCDGLINEGITIYLN